MERCSILKEVPTKTSGSTVSQLPPVDPVAEMYRKTRDIIICSEGVGRGERIGILELLKHELLTNMHNEIHE
jgi:hypothetical protein